MPRAPKPEPIRTRPARAPRNKIEKIAAMAAQTASPAEAAVAQSMLAVVPQDEGAGAMELVSLARNALQQANTLTDFREVLDRAVAIKTYVKRRGIGIETENAASEVILRAERSIGGVLAAIERQPTGPSKGLIAKVSPTPFEAAVTESGLGPKAAWQFQTLARATDEQFEDALRNAVAVEERLSRAAIERYLPRPERAAPPVRDMGAGPVARNVGPILEGVVVERTEYDIHHLPKRILGEGEAVWRADYDDAIAALNRLGAHAMHGWPQAGDWAIPRERVEEVARLERALKNGVVFYQKMKDL